MEEADALATIVEVESIDPATIMQDNLNSDNTDPAVTKSATSSSTSTDGPENKVSTCGKSMYLTLLIT